MHCLAKRDRVRHWSWIAAFVFDLCLAFALGTKQRAILPAAVFLVIPATAAATVVDSAAEVYATAAIRVSH